MSFSLEGSEPDPSAKRKENDTVHPVKQAGYWWLVLEFVGHLLGTGIIFVSFFTIAWILSALLNLFNRIYPFPPEIFAYVTKFESYLVIIDSGFCGILILGGGLRFLRERFK